MKRNRRHIIVAIALVSLVAGFAQVAAHAEAPAGGTQPVVALPRLEKPVPQIERAVLISIDGCRPDVLLRAKMPNVRKLMETGSYTFWARTIPVAVTLPSHASMLTGVTPEKHGITWNKELDNTDPAGARPKVPTVFEIAIRHGMTTAIVAGKSKFSAFAQPGHIGKAWTKAANSDEEVAAAAVDMIHGYRPELLFVHFPGVDHVGHASGWASPEQVAAMEDVDTQIGKVVAAVDESGTRDKTVFLITADHGGAGRSHGTATPDADPTGARSQHIPWIINGPGLRKDYDLSRDPTLSVQTTDTFATLCYLLGLQPEGAIDGKPVKLAVEELQLLEETAK